MKSPRRLAPLVCPPSVGDVDGDCQKYVFRGGQHAARRSGGYPLNLLRDGQCDDAPDGDCKQCVSKPAGDEQKCACHGGLGDSHHPAELVMMDGASNLGDYLMIMRDGATQISA